MVQEGGAQEQANTPHEMILMKPEQDHIQGLTKT
jgi:hypothetical protein